LTTTETIAGRLAHLDGLRGMAAMIVVLSHCAQSFQPALLSGKPGGLPAFVWISRTPLTLLFDPELGVAIFFVLSGFVLAASVTATPASFAELAVRRWIRLAGPILATSLVIWAAVQAGLLGNRALAAQNGSDWLAMNFAWLSIEDNNLALLVWQSLVDIFARGRHWWNFALWTMPIELWGSLGLFACYALLRRKAPPVGRLLVAIALMALLWRSAYGGFAAGAALFESSGLLPSSSRWRAVAAPAGAALLGIGLVLGGTPYNIFDTPYWPPYLRLAPLIDNPVLAAHRLGALCIVAATLLLPGLRHFLTLRPLRWLGRVSFMVYLLHVILICTLYSRLVLWLSPQLGYHASTGLALPVFLAALLAAARVATSLFDAPSIRLAARGGAQVARFGRGLADGLQLLAEKRAG